VGERVGLKMRKYGWQGRRGRWTYCPSLSGWYVYIKVLGPPVTVREVARRHSLGLAVEAFVEWDGQPMA